MVDIDELVESRTELVTSIQDADCEEIFNEANDIRQIEEAINSIENEEIREKIREEFEDFKEKYSEYGEGEEAFLQIEVDN